MTYTIVIKDWERMQDLIDRNKDGEDVAAKIKNKAKAVARYVAGVKLMGRVAVESGRLPYSDFRAFGLRALELGATIEDIQSTFEAAAVPEDFAETHITKDPYTGYTGSLRRFIDQMCVKYGLESSLQSVSGTSTWSGITTESYYRNGRVWPLSYKLTFRNDFESVQYSIVVVTNEGGGNYGYDFNCCRMPWGMIKTRIENELKKL